MKKKIVNLSLTIVRGIKNLWKKYHFLVPPKMWKKYIRFLWSIIHENKIPPFFSPFDVDGYKEWIEQNEKEEELDELKYRPLISILIPVYNVKGKYLRECIESVLGQSYDNYEICIVDDASTDKETLRTLEEFGKNKKIKIKHRKTNGHISRATNDALKMATGDFVALLDNDDILSENALYEVVKVLNENKKLDFIYSDEDKLSPKGERCEPNFKPDFSPDTLLSMNYICHLSVIRTSLMREIGGFTIGLEGAQDYDLFLRLSERTKNIFHIHKILYHWRMIPGSTSVKTSSKQYADDNGKKAIEDALKRRGIKGRVEKDEKVPFYKVIYEFDKEPMVSILIPTKNHAEVTERCLRTIYDKTSYKNFEVILIDNGSTEKRALRLFDEYENKYDNFRVLREDIKFNYSRLNNLAAKQAKGEYLVLLNNDTEIITSDWLGLLVGYAALPHVGAVGAKLLYPDDTLQHGGVVLGLGGGVATHVFLNTSRDDVGMYGRLRVPYDYSAVTAACLCVSKKKFEEVGGLEEKLEVAFNDVDFNLKLLEKGYYNVFVPMAELYHHESKSRGSDISPENYGRFMKESDYMWKKWGDVLENDKFYNKNFTKRTWFLLDREPVSEDFYKRVEYKKGKKEKNILFVVEDMSVAQYRYRVKNVIEVLEKYTNWGAGVVLSSEVNDTYLMNVNLVVILRQAAKDGRVLELIERAHGRGLRVVFDLDDLVFNYSDLLKILKGVHGLNAPYWFGYIRGIRKIATKVDGFIATNGFLAKRLRESFEKPTKVIPNSLNHAQVEVANENLDKKKHGEFVVGYFSGSPTHVKDLGLVSPEIFRFMDNHKDVRLRLVGYIESSKETQNRVKSGQVEILGLVDYLEQIKMMAKVDVNIAPLVISDFTNCKSELKFFEAATVETVTIASPTYAFKKAIKNGENGFLAQPGEWYDRLEYLYENPSEREKIAKNARKYALENYYGEEICKKIESAYGDFMRTS